MHNWQEVRQGCSLSPLLYVICDEATIRESTDNLETGIKVGGHIVNTIRHADDKVTQVIFQSLLNHTST